MKNRIILILSVALFASCSVRHDRQLIETAEALLYTNRDSAELLLRQVERPERLDDAHLAKYWFVTCDLHANSMQSLSEDSMICWTADYFRHEWLEEHGDARNMMLSGLDEAMYWWWNGDREKAQQVLQRQKTYADEVAELTGDHLWQVVVLRVSAELAMRDYDYERVRDYTEMLIGIDDGKAIHLDEVERVYNALAIVYFSLGEYDQMAQCFEKAIANASDSAFIVNVVRRNYADLLGETGQTDRAIRMLEELAAQYREADNWLLVESLCSLSRLWLSKGDKQRADRYMREAEELFDKYKESSEFDPATEAGLLAHRQVLDYALKGTYTIYPLTQYHNRWSEKDYIRYRIAEAKERSMRDLRERNLYLTISRQRQAMLIIALVFIALGAWLLVVYIIRRRKQLLIEKEEEIETLRNLLTSTDKPDNKENVRKLMLQQLGIIKTIAGTPTEANQHLLSRLMALNEDTAAALIDWQSIYQTIDLVYDGFYSRLVKRYSENGQSAPSGQSKDTKEQRPQLNEKEIQLCCLLRADFSTKEINMLTRQSLQTIYQRKTQVRQKLGLDEGDDIPAKLG
ncbi:MAG: tetratricopeptide repeat protein [Paludibacteraceae bacterium]|nr:tetratricopeptide repeat protein [Paludibacteraceae bacterium]